MKKLSSISNNKTSLVLLILALIVGGVGAQAKVRLNTKSGGYLVCVNTKTKVVTYPGKSTCPKGNKKLVLGAKGSKGTKGSAGPIGLTGAPGINATTAITELSVCDGTDDGTVADEKCKIGMTGPGGGLIFFVDYNDQYAGFNYLEAAPKSCEATKPWSSDTSHSLIAVNGWAARAVGSGQANTTAMLANGPTDYVGDVSGAAFYASTLANGVPAGCVTSKDDWFLGSLGEMKLMYDNLQGFGAFDDFYYWSSNETYAPVALHQDFGQGGVGSIQKTFSFRVRPVRVF